MSLAGGLNCTRLVPGNFHLPDLRRGLTDVCYCAPGIDRQVVLCRLAGIRHPLARSRYVDDTYLHDVFFDRSGTAIDKLFSSLPAFVVYVGANERSS